MSDRPDDAGPTTPQAFRTVTESDPPTTVITGDKASSAEAMGAAPVYSADETVGVVPVDRDPWRRLALVTGLLAIVAFGLSLLSVLNATRLSALDEATHVDYAYRLSHGELTYSGEPLSDYTLNAWSCRGQANIPRMPACGSGADNPAFPADGLQYNAFHPPLYYAITGATARILSAVTGQDFITMARSLGGVWLFVSMLTMYLTLRYWRVRPVFAFGGALLLPLFPTVLHASSIVTNDAPAMLGGIAALFVLGRAVIYQKYGWILPVVFAALITATKAISAMPFLAVAITLFVLGIIAWRPDRTAGFALIRTSVLMPLAVGAVQFGWQAIQGGRTAAGYISPVAGVNTRQIVGAPFDEWIPTLLDGARLGSIFYLDPTVNSPYLVGWVLLITSIVAAAGLLGIAVYHRGTPQWIAAGTLLIGVLTYPLVVQVQTSFDGAYFPGVPNRYGLALLPLAVGVLVFIVELKRLRITSVVMLTLGGAAMLTATLGIGRG